MRASLGTIVPRKDRPGFMGQASLTVNGRRTRPTFYGLTPDEVEAQLLKFRNQHEARIDLTKASTSELLDRWLDTKDLRDSSRSRYADVIRLYIAPAIGNVRAAKVTGLDIDKMLADLADRGVKPDKAYIVTKAAFSWAFKKRILPLNPALDADRPDIDDSDSDKFTPLTPDQGKALRLSLEHDPLLPLVEVALETGMRQGELLGLRWDRVDLTACTIRIDQQLKEKTGSPPFLDGLKTETGARTLTISTRLKVVLTAQRLRAGSSAWVFPTSTGTPWLKSNLRRSWAAALARAFKAGVPKVRWHDLRHTNATWLIDAGVDVKTVASRLGNSAAVCLKVYVHRTKKSDSRAAELVAEAMG